ncbi:MAG: hypothetical protein FWE37_00485 [Spirochaetaceae bacterium]|nr:hypothetical protein [Spirochaetaceae bacterium]
MPLTFKQFFDTAIEIAIDNDPRDKAAIAKLREKAQKDYDALKTEAEKERFDKDRLVHPYSDSRIINDSGKEIKQLMVGIDCEGPELLLADQLNERGKAIDLVLTHHPSGKSRPGVTGVMSSQNDFLEQLGVPISQAEIPMKKWVAELDRRIHPGNHTRADSFSKLLNISFGCIHTPADLMVENYLNNRYRNQEDKYYYLSDIMEDIYNIPEYQQAACNNAPAAIYAGAKDNRAGKIIVQMAGGTTGSIKTYENLVRAGYSTLIVMHLPDNHREECEKQNLNVVMVGHMASDSLGLNLLFDEIQRRTKQNFTVLPVAGFLQHSRL